MRIITISNSRGGVGKTTLAAILSTAAANVGIKVLAIDLDPDEVLMLWSHRRMQEHNIEIPECMAATDDGLAAALSKAEEAGYELVIIDAPLMPPGTLTTVIARNEAMAASAVVPLKRPDGGSANVLNSNIGHGTGAAIKAADTVLIPFSHQGMNESKPVLGTVGFARKHSRTIYGILNHAQYEGMEETRDWAAGAGLMVSPHVLHTCQDHNEAMKIGLLASELKPRGVAAREANDLGNWFRKDILKHPELHLVT